MNKQNGFFADLKVVELAAVLAGPAVGMFFAELGAKVLKVEHPGLGGDMTRKWKIKEEKKDAPVSAYYASVNYGKEVLWLDLGAAEDREKLLLELADTDILISNFKRKSAIRMGLNPAKLLAQFPKLIYGQIDAFGAQEERPAFDAVLQAEAGFMYMNGHPDQAPTKMPVALIDILAAHQLKEGLLIALLARERSGKGKLVSTSLFDAAVCSMANQASNFLMAGKIAQRMGSLHPNIAPYGEIFETKDALSIILAVGTDQHFERLCTILELPQLCKDERFAKNELRVIHRQELFTLLQEKIIDWERVALMDCLILEKVPAGAIRTIDEVFELPAAQRLVIEEQIKEFRTRAVRTVAFDLDAPLF